MINLNLRRIAEIMGGDASGRDSVNVPGPGHSAADRSLSIKLNARAPAGFVVYSHAGDDPLRCRDYVRAKLGLETWSGRRDNAPLVVSVPVTSEQLKARKELALKIWHQAVEPRGTVVEKYLVDVRGLRFPDHLASKVVRFHGALHYDGGRCPGMVCLMRDVTTDEPLAIHRTFLHADGRKRERRMLGIAKHSAIKIDDGPSSLGALTIGEGLETCIAGRMAGFEPTWAVASAGAIRHFPVLNAVKELTLLEENDVTSRVAVKACVARYLKADRPVIVVTPLSGKDLNDVVQSCR